MDKRYNIKYVKKIGEQIEEIKFDSLQKAILFCLNKQGLNASKKNKSKIRKYILDSLDCDNSYFLGGKWYSENI